MPKKPVPSSRTKSKSHDQESKEAKSPILSATNVTTTRSQALAMSTPQTSSAHHESDIPESAPGQENPGSIPSQESARGNSSQEGTESTSPQESPLSPGWVHAITIILGHPLKSEIGQELQKWVLYHAIHDPTNFWLSWDPSDYEDMGLLQKYVEKNRSTTYLPSSMVKNLISLWNYMNILIKQDRPAERKHNKLYYVMDEQWTKLTAYNMWVALINVKLDNQGTTSSPESTSAMFHYKLSPAPMRSPTYMELASFKKCIKHEASAYSILKDERYFDEFQRDRIITAKSYDVSEIFFPTFTPGPTQEEQELFDAKQTFMYKVFNETLMTDMGRTKVWKCLKTTDAQAVWKEYSRVYDISIQGSS